ncbi:chorismate mutase [Methanolacinia paynteri]|uniref:chorismate mutase n=1 Tax=Methanolacinia paynteri TaxID=230356 RepID=UPI00064EE178|nr:chorismate mutase [Methanolacinia paynteri]
MNLEESRLAIEGIDRDIVALIAKRQEYSAFIAAEKKKSGSSVRDEVQRRKVLDRAAVLASESELDEESVVKIFDILVEMNEKAQKNCI